MEGYSNTIDRLKEQLAEMEQASNANFVWATRLEAAAKEVDRRAIENWGEDLPDEFAQLHKVLADKAGNAK